MHDTVKPLTIGVPGIHSDGRDSIARVLTDLRDTHDLRTRLPDLPVRWALTARFMKSRDSRIVEDSIRDGDGLICHSYGCLRGTLGAIRAYKENGAVVRLLFLLAPAMEEDFDFSELHPDTRIVCAYSKDDNAVRVGAALWWHPFGAAGNRGFTSNRVEGIPAHGNDHNDYFNLEQAGKWSDYYAERFLR